MSAAGSRPLPGTAENRSVLVVLGCVALAVAEWSSAASQVGEAHCAVCHVGRDCTGSTSLCPGTPYLLAADGLFLAVGPILVTFGLAPGAAPPRGRAAREAASDPGPRDPRRAGRLGVFAIFYGAGWLAAGLLLPWDGFGYCVELCRYPYSLQGLPLAFAIAGGVLFSTGLVPVVVRSRRSSRRPR